MRLIKLILYIYLVWTRSRSKTFLLFYRPPKPKCRKSWKVEFYFLQNVLDSFLFPNGDQLQETFKHVYSVSYLSIEDLRTTSAGRQLRYYWSLWKDRFQTFNGVMLGTNLDDKILWGSRQYPVPASVQQRFGQVFSD